jgi:hypothetical protein
MSIISYQIPKNPGFAVYHRRTLDSTESQCGGAPLDTIVFQWFPVVLGDPFISINLWVGGIVPHTQLAKKYLLERNQRANCFDSAV